MILSETEAHQTTQLSTLHRILCLRNR